MSEPTATVEADVAWTEPTLVNGWRNATPSSVADEFEDWFRSTVADLPGLATEHYNRFRAAADEFKARLRQKG